MKISIKTALNIAVFFIFVVVGQLLWSLSASYQLASPHIISIRSGASLREIAYDLYEQGVVPAPETLIAYLKFIGKANAIRAGEYEFGGELNLKKVARILLSGKVKQYAFTVVEGWHIDQLIDALEKTNTLQHADAIPLTKERIAQELNIATVNPEGWFFPDTYFYTRTSSSMDILKRAHKNMLNALAFLWKKRPRSLPYKTPYEALIVASMIEKETAVPEERPVIASVIINRLYRNMPLQIDPTVIYGAGHEIKLTKQMLKSDTPYNTYLHRGLPPTPIALPSIDSMRAAILPAFTDYFYFVARGDGTHVFSRTLSEQSRAIRRYQFGSVDAS